MGAFTGVKEFFNRPLADVAKEMGYDEDNILILKGDEQGLMTNYPETYNNILSCKHHADSRKQFEYAQDLVASWLMEDYVLSFLMSSKYELSLDGADRKRKILPSSRTSASSDYLLSCNGVSIPVELMNDYTGFWAKKHVLHLRDDKFLKLKRSSSLLLAISTPSKNFTIYDFRTEVTARYLEYHQLYHKPAYELDIPDDIMIPLTQQNLEQKLIALLQKKN